MAPRAIHRLTGLLIVALMAAPEPSVAQTSAGAEVHMTRYGTTFRSLWVTTVDATLELAVHPDLALLLRVPMVVTHRGGDGCCLVSSGNITPGVRYRVAREPVHLAVEASASPPSAVGPADARVFNATYAAGAELYRDAGLFMDATCLRLGVMARKDLGAHWAVLGSAALHDWRLHGEDYLLVPLTLGAGYALSPVVESTATLITLIKPDEEEQVLQAVQLGVSRTTPRWLIGARVTVPLDASARRLGMVGGGFTLARRWL